MAIRLPLLRPELDPVDRIEISTPCSVPWDSMYGDERIRHCGSCRKNVYNVAALTRAQAMELIASREPVCLRIYRRPDGTVVTNDCWSRLRAARRRGMWAFVVMLLIVGWAQLAAMFVGLAGLRRLVLEPRMGGAPIAPPPAIEVPRAFDPPPVDPVPPQTLGELKGGHYFAGGIGPSPEGRHIVGRLKPPPHPKKAKPPKVEPEDTEVLGDIIERL